MEASRITGITYISPSSVTATFEKDSRIHPLNSYSPWMSKWKGRGMVDPEQDCSLKKADRGSSHQLICSSAVVQERINI